MTAFWEKAPRSLVEVDRRFRRAYCLHHQGAILTEAPRTSETSDYFKSTRPFIPEVCHLHTLGRKNVKSHMEAVWSSETLVSTKKSTRCYNQQHRHLHLRENVGSRTL
jgi:hypothetical protein